MQADPKIQLQLLKLAELDTELNRIKHAAQTLPEHAEIKRLTDERKGLVDLLTLATTQADDLGITARKAAEDLLPVQARLKKNQERANDGSVSDPKVLRGLLDEIEHIKGRISDLEDAQLVAMNEHEEAVAQRDALAARKSESEDEIRKLVAARNTAAEALKEEANAVVSARGAVTKGLPEALLKTYERLRANTGMGAGRLAGSRCGACRLELNAADLAALKKAPSNQVVYCPECDRILVRASG